MVHSLYPYLSQTSLPQLIGVVALAVTGGVSMTTLDLEMLVSPLDIDSLMAGTIVPAKSMDHTPTVMNDVSEQFYREKVAAPMSKLPDQY